MKSMLLLLLILTPLALAQSYGFGLGPSNTLASSTASYVFGISLDGSSGAINIQSGAQVQISFPADYTSRLTSGAATCNLFSFGDGTLSTLPTPSCSISGNAVTIDSLFTQAYTINSYFDITLQVNSILNPLASGLTGSFTAYVFATTGTITISASGIGITAATMTCSASPSPTTINSNGVINVQFTTPEF